MGKKSRRPGRANRDRAALRAERAQVRSAEQQLALVRAHPNYDKFENLRDALTFVYGEDVTKVILGVALTDERFVRRIFEVLEPVDGDDLRMARQVDAIMTLTAWHQTLGAYRDDVRDRFMEGRSVTSDGMHDEGTAALNEIDARIWWLVSEGAPLTKLVNDETPDQIAARLTRAEKGIRRMDADDKAKRR